MSRDVFCFNCFKQLNTEGEKCPYCGYHVSMDKDKYPMALPHGTILNGKYIVGRVLGQGGFGITYIAQDWKSKKLVAVKEYLPDTMAARTGSHMVTAYQGQRGESFLYGKECFLQEAKTLAEFIGNSNIVCVYSYFEENGTAYFVMDYVKGVSLQSYIKNHGGRIPWKEAMQYLVPVMQALGQVHSKGIIHRDVTPDNIYLTADGTVKLLDFGAARYSLGDRSRSLDVVLKHGFAPKEQYTRHGRQGPYTDVYTVGASFYYAITGRKPPDSIDRLDEDDLIPPRSVGIDVPEQVEDAILKALSVQPMDRFQNMEEFLVALGEAAKVASCKPLQETSQPVKSEAQPKPEIQKDASKNLEASEQITEEKTADDNQQQKIRKRTPWLFALAGVAVVAVVLVSVIAMNAGKGVPVPDVVGMRLEDAKETLEAAGLVVIEDKGSYNSDVAAGYVSFQEHLGETVPKNTEIHISASLGKSKISLVDVTGKTRETATKQLESLGLRISVQEAYDSTIETGYVISQVPASGMQVESNSIVTITVSLGPELVMVPNLIGMSQADAIAEIEACGLVVGEIDSSYSDASEETVIWQSIDADNWVEPQSVIAFTISLGALPEPESEQITPEPPVTTEPPTSSETQDTPTSDNNDSGKGNGDSSGVPDDEVDLSGGDSSGDDDTVDLN